MDLDKLYKMQEKLDKTILNNERKRTGKEIDKDLLLNQTILALQVEVAELANETRCFKHWSTKGPNNKVSIPCELCDGTGDENYHMIMEAAESNMKHEYIECEECGGTGIIGYKNPILEEYVDVLHFYLSLGNQLNYKMGSIHYYLDEEEIEFIKDLSLIGLFIFLGQNALQATYDIEYYTKYGYQIQVLGYKLGFTKEDIDMAYLGKHKMNYKRQEEGY